MVKKLIRHEFIYYVRTFSIFLPIVLAIGIMTRVFFLFDAANNFVAEIAQLSSSAMLFVASCALLVMSSIISITRFYKNMYSAEGYLTFTLPVTNSQHVLVKLLAAVSCQGVSVLTIAASVAIALSGERLKTLLQSISIIIDPLASGLGAVNVVFLAIEAIVMLIVSSASTLLLFYACITIGQTAKKNRVLMAVITYFIYYMASQALGTVVVMIIVALGSSGVLDNIMIWTDYHYVATRHIYFCTSILVSAALSAAFYFVTLRVMNKKLNLE